MPDPEELERAVERLRALARISRATQRDLRTTPGQAREDAIDIETVLAALSTEGAQERGCTCPDESFVADSACPEHGSPRATTDPFPAPEQPQGEGRTPERKIPDGLLDDLAARAARRLAPVYAAAGWKWRDQGVPDQAQLASAIRACMANIEDQEGSSATGRFQVDHHFEDGYDNWSVSVEAAHALYKPGELLTEEPVSEVPSPDTPEERGLPTADEVRGILRCPAGHWGKQSAVRCTLPVGHTGPHEFAAREGTTHD